ncbi:unnamed protein product, partial [Sphagnum jensenii]
MRDERERAGGLAVACRGLLLQIFHKKRFPCNLFLANFLRSYGESCRKWRFCPPSSSKCGWKCICGFARVIACLL